MQNIEPSRLPFRESLNQRPWQEWAEYSCVAGSALGTVVAALSGQVAYAAVPLTLALTLNLSNRTRTEQQAGQQTTSAIADVRQVVESIHASVRETPAAAPLDLDPVHQEISQLRQVIQRLEKTAVREDDWETVNVRLLLIQEEIAKVSGAIESGNTSGSAIEAGESGREIEEAIAQIDLLIKRVATLEQQNKQIVKPYLKRLTRSLKKLEYMGAIAGLKAQLEGWRSQWQSEGQLAEDRELRDEIRRVTEELTQLQQDFEALQLDKIEAAIAQLSEKVTAIATQIQH